MRQTLLAIALVITASGCQYYQDYRVKKTTADVNAQRAESMRAHRDCLHRYEGHPRAEEICRPYGAH